jgi:RNA polymerase sigma factor (TIGR02999 family)
MLPDPEGQAPDGVPDPPRWDSVYRELRALATHFLSHDRRNHTLQPTALVHEAFLRLQGSRHAAAMDRLEFCRAAASAMRRILMDYARYRLRKKRDVTRRSDVVVDLDELSGPIQPETYLDLEAALEKLEQVDPRRAEIVRLRFFAGLEESEVAEMLGVSKGSVQYDFRVARAWLRTKMEHRAGDSSPTTRSEV